MGVNAIITRRRLRRFNAIEYLCNMYIEVNMENALNFRTQKGQEDYYQAYDKTLQLWDVEYSEEYIDTSFGKSHCLICGDIKTPPLVLLHAASCGATIWYPNIKALSQYYCVYAIDLITEASKSTLLSPIKNQEQCAMWLEETISGLDIKKFCLCGLSIGGWHAVNYSSVYPQKVKKLILLSPVQTFVKMYTSFYIKIIKMGFKPTRKSVEECLGCGRTKEVSLPDSVMEQFVISAMNISVNATFPKMLKKQVLKNLAMPVLVLFGENEFIFDIKKATDIAKSNIEDLEIETVMNVSHLISVSSPEFTNTRILKFLSK